MSLEDDLPGFMRPQGAKIPCNQVPVYVGRLGLCTLVDQSRTESVNRFHIINGGFTLIGYGKSKVDGISGNYGGAIDHLCDDQMWLHISKVHRRSWPVARKDY